MAARDVTCFVGNNSNEFARPIELHDRAGVYEEVLSFRDERIQRAVIDQVDLNGRGREVGRRENGVGPAPDGVLDLGIAHKRLRVALSHL